VNPPPRGARTLARDSGVGDEKEVCARPMECVDEYLKGHSERIIGT
jgi:hypothetical protein